MLCFDEHRWPSGNLKRFYSGMFRPLQRPRVEQRGVTRETVDA